MNERMNQTIRINGLTESIEWMNQMNKLIKSIEWINQMNKSIEWMNQ